MDGRGDSLVDDDWRLVEGRRRRHIDGLGLGLGLLVAVAVARRVRGLRLVGLLGPLRLSVGLLRPRRFGHVVGWRRGRRGRVGVRVRRGSGELLNLGLFEKVEIRKKFFEMLFLFDYLLIDMDGWVASVDDVRSGVGSGGGRRIGVFTSQGDILLLWLSGLGLLSGHVFGPLGFLQIKSGLVQRRLGRGVSLLGLLVQDVLLGRLLFLLVLLLDFFLYRLLLNLLRLLLLLRLGSLTV